MAIDLADSMVIGGGPKQICLINGFEVRLDRDPREIARSAERLLAFLALEGRPMTRSRIAGHMWPDVAESRALANLRTALWRLGELRSTVVVASQRSVRLRDDVTLDHATFGRMAEAVTKADGAPETSVADAIIKSVDVLPEWDEDWSALLIARERHRESRLRALEHLSFSYLESEQVAPAIDCAMAAVASEPLRDRARRALVRAHLQAGNYGAATRAFDSYSDLLRVELGVEPPASMAQFVR